MLGNILSTSHVHALRTLILTLNMLAMVIPVFTVAWFLIESILHSTLIRHRGEESILIFSVESSAWSSLC